MLGMKMKLNQVDIADSCLTWISLWLITKKRIKNYQIAKKKKNVDQYRSDYDQINLNVDKYDRQNVCI